MKPRANLLFTLLLGFALAAATVLLSAPQALAQSDNACVDRPPDVASRYFVFGVAADDPDGGLVMRSGPGVEWSMVGVLQPTSGEVWPTGQCRPSSTGSAWFEIYVDTTSPPVWVSSNFLRLAEPACLLETQTSSPSLSPHNSGDLLVAGPGYAIRSGSKTAFLGFISQPNGYQFVATNAVTTPQTFCPADTRPLAPVPSFPPVLACNPGPCSPPELACQPGSCFEPAPYFWPVPYFEPVRVLPPPQFPPPFAPWEHGLVVCG